MNLLLVVTTPMGRTKTVSQMTQWNLFDPSIPGEKTIWAQKIVLLSCTNQERTKGAFNSITLSFERCSLQLQFL